jgi:hypothetical protein
MFEAARTFAHDRGQCIQGPGQTQDGSSGFFCFNSSPLPTCISCRCRSLLRLQPAVSKSPTAPPLIGGLREDGSQSPSSSLTPSKAVSVSRWFIHMGGGHLRHFWTPADSALLPVVPYRVRSRPQSRSVVQSFATAGIAAREAEETCQSGVQASKSPTPSTMYLWSVLSQRAEPRHSLSAGGRQHGKR